jgi:hypothetical protein
VLVRALIYYYPECAPRWEEPNGRPRLGYIRGGQQHTQQRSYTLSAASMGENSSLTFLQAVQLLRDEGMLPQPDDRPTCPLFDMDWLCTGTCVLVYQHNYQTMRRKTLYLCTSCNVYWSLGHFVQPVTIDLQYNPIRSIRRLAQMVLDSRIPISDEAMNYQATQTLS